MKIVYTIKNYCHIVDDDNFNYTSFQKVKTICGKTINARIHVNQDITNLSKPMCPRCSKRGYDTVLAVSAKKGFTWEFEMFDIITLKSSTKDAHPTVLISQNGNNYKPLTDNPPVNATRKYSIGMQNIMYGNYIDNDSLVYRVEINEVDMCDTIVLMASAKGYMQVNEISHIKESITNE